MLAPATSKEIELVYDGNESHKTLVLQRQVTSVDSDTQLYVWH